jgi:hypothetical protein
MTAIFSFGKARHTIQRWLLGEEGKAAGAISNSVKRELPSEQEDSADQRIFQFMEELKASSQEWLGRVRMINFDSIRERVGPAWAKLQAGVEILAEKVIQDEMAGRDRYLKAGNAEFLVFFADAAPEESRIRCLAIVEAIHEKLFGFDDTGNNSGHKVAECHVINRGDLALEWEAASSLVGSEPPHQSPAKALRGSFRRDAEILDEADITASAQIVIDSIISRGSESRNTAELTPLLMRLQFLSRSLKTLELALIATKKAPNDRSDQPIEGAQANHGEDKSETDNAATMPLVTAWQDIAELISVLDFGPDHSHGDLLAALGKLRCARLERAATALAGDDILTARLNGKNPVPGQFEYTPVYRSVSRGERIHQGLYRVGCRSQKEAEASADDDLTGHQRQDAMASERAALEHAIQYLLDRRASARFMLMASVHVETLRGPNSLMRYSIILRSAQLRAKRRLLIEVVGYCDADDTIGIRRAINELRVHSHAVFITLSHKSVGNLEKIVAECKASGIHAFGIDVSQWGERNADIIGAIKRLSSVGEQHSIPTFVDGIGSVPVLAKAIANGVRYVCAPALRPPLATPGDADLATLDDLYSAV